MSERHESIAFRVRCAAPERRLLSPLSFKKGGRRNGAPTGRVGFVSNRANTCTFRQRRLKLRHTFERRVTGEDRIRLAIPHVHGPPDPFRLPDRRAVETGVVEHEGRPRLCVNIHSPDPSGKLPSERIRPQRLVRINIARTGVEDSQPPLRRLGQPSLRLGALGNNTRAVRRLVYIVKVVDNDGVKYVFLSAPSTQPLSSRCH